MKTPYTVTVIITVLHVPGEPRTYYRNFKQNEDIHTNILLFTPET
jgi:hypothetical protein